MKPSVDTAIHLEIYKAFPEIKSIIHSHSKFATSWAQALSPIPIVGTTHADYFLDDIPLARQLEESELDEYEKNLGQSVVDFFQSSKINPKHSSDSSSWAWCHGFLRFPPKDSRMCYSIRGNR